MGVKENRELIERYFAVVGGEDTHTPISDFFADDVRWTGPRSNPLFPENPVVGRDNVMQLFAQGVGIYHPGSMAFTVQSLTVDAQRVCAQFTLDALLADGRAYTNDYIMLFEIRDDKVVAVYEYLDTLYQQQLGALDG